MDRPSEELGRRGFLKKALQALAAGAAAARVAYGADPGDTIPTRVFGRTGLELPILGFGGAALPREWGNPLSYEDRVGLVRYAYDRGVRYFDTGGNYLESQSILGEALEDVRGDVYLAAKVETTDPGRVRAAVEKSLKELRTEYVDVIEIHGTPGLEQMSVERAMEVHQELLKLRDEGVAQHIGFSAHSYFDKALALIASEGFDMCMLSYGYIPRGHNQVFSPRMIELRDSCLAKAHELGMGIAAMKVLGVGALGGWSEYYVPEFDRERRRQLPGAAIRHVLQDDRVHLLTIGMRLKQDIDSNIEILSDDTAYTAEDRALLAEFGPKVLESDPIKAMRVD